MYCSDNFRNVTVKQYQFSEFTLNFLKFDILCTCLTTRMHLLLKVTNGIVRRHNKMPKWDILWFVLLLNINTNNPSSIFTQTALNPEYMPEMNMPEVLQPRPPDPCPCKVCTSSLEDLCKPSFNNCTFYFEKLSPNYCEQASLHIFPIWLHFLALFLSWSLVTLREIIFQC